MTPRLGTFLIKYASVCFSKLLASYTRLGFRLWDFVCTWCCLQQAFLQAGFSSYWQEEPAVADRKKNVWVGDVPVLRSKLPQCEELKSTFVFVLISFNFSPH